MKNIQIVVFKVLQLQMCNHSSWMCFYCWWVRVPISTNSHIPLSSLLSPQNCALLKLHDWMVCTNVLQHYLWLPYRPFQPSLSHVQVFLNNKLCGTITWIKGTNPYHISCGIRTSIRNIKVISRKRNLNDNFVTPCEVEVFSQATNIAKYGVATQESTAHGGTAIRAIDGDTAGYHHPEK